VSSGQNKSTRRAPEAAWTTARLAVTLSILLAGCSSSGSGAPHAAVACADLRELRDLGSQLVLVENPRTGNTLEYIVVGDGADSDEVLVLFPGTAGILPDWPTQMITNATASPRIVDTPSYDPQQNADVSLCHSYRLLLFDYAGVGDGNAAIEQTFDSTASDVDALLDDAATRYGISTSDVSPIGWSLGSNASLKFAYLSAASAPQRQIHDVVLIATRPGGGTDPEAIGNQAQCVTALLDALQQPISDSAFQTRLETLGFQLTFPYVGQQPYDGASSGCTGSVDVSSASIELSVSPDPCLPGTECARMYADQLANRETEPWSKTGGVPFDVYLNQRAFDSDYDACSCAAGGPDFTSEDCTCYAPVQISSTNGGVCQCEAAPGEPQSPMCSSCIDLRNDGKVTVINGPDDMFVQWTYGRELVRAYQAQYGDDKAAIVTYSGAGGAGHGILLQHPGWTQEQIFAALAG
jgi:pimeloyl-ACP methyl ester carboxylesterase